MSPRQAEDVQTSLLALKLSSYSGQTVILGGRQSQNLLTYIERLQRQATAWKIGRLLGLARKPVR